MSDVPELIPAATVLLLRNGEAGVEVLMVRRNSKIAFGGMWVFPGGRVDDGDAHGPGLDDGAGPGAMELAGATGAEAGAAAEAGEVLAVARRAAVREVEEETGLTVAVEDLVPWSYWVPPPMAVMPGNGPRRRFSTWFFAVHAPGGEVAIDHGEIHEDKWMTPASALTQQQHGSIELAPPTWISLWQLSRHDSTGSALNWARDNRPRFFQTRPLQRKPLVLAWGGDAAYERAGHGHDESADVIDIDGPRNRLIMDPEGWRYDFRDA